MDIALLILAVITLIFGFVIFFGAPYLPTTTRQIEAALKLLKLKKGEHLLELGAGDGSVALAALKKIKFNANEIPIFADAVIYKRGEYWQFRIWLYVE